jgi:DIS3-like exonuclease 1
VYDAVITKLKDNGFVVHVPRFGINGAIYLRSKDGVVSVPRSFYRPRSDKDTIASLLALRAADPVLSSLTASRTALTVSCADGQQQQQQQHVFHLFDHVMVLVSVVTSRYRSCEFSFELIAPSSKQAAAANAGTKQDVIKEVLSAGDKSAAADTAETTTTKKKKKAGKDSDGEVVAYDVLEQFRALSLQCDDGVLDI